MTEAIWVGEMRRFYDKNGVYRPDDLLRVFGDPRKGVCMPRNPEEARSWLEKGL